MLSVCTGLVKIRENYVEQEPRLFPKSSNQLTVRSGNSLYPEAVVLRKLRRNLQANLASDRDHHTFFPQFTQRLVKVTFV